MGYRGAVTDAEFVPAGFVPPRELTPPGASDPLEGAAGVAAVSSWVRADRAELDEPLHRAVTEWLERDWPFPRFEYAPR